MTQLMTIEEFAEISEPGRFDLIHGEVLRIPPAGGEHGEVAGELGRIIRNFVVEHDLGRFYAAETGFILNETDQTVLAPDVAFVQTSRLPPRDRRRGFVPVVPDLVVEVFSTSDLAVDVIGRILAYLSAGVRATWVVDSVGRHVTVYNADQTGRILRDGDELDGGDVLPAFRLKVAEVFR